MISAQVARFESKNLKEVRELEEGIELSIKDAVDKGQFQCSVSISTNVSSEVRKRIKEDLTALGYAVSISDSKASEWGCPVDQMSYYDEIKIDWEG